MVHTINYGGDATVAMDAVLRELCSDNGFGISDWFVEIETHDGETHSGFVANYEEPTSGWSPPADGHGPTRVTNGPSFGLSPSSGGGDEARDPEIRFNTEDIAILTIP